MGLHLDPALNAGRDDHIALLEPSNAPGDYVAGAKAYGGRSCQQDTPRADSYPQSRSHAAFYQGSFEHQRAGLAGNPTSHGSALRIDGFHQRVKNIFKTD